MLVRADDPDEFEPVVQRHVCTFHELNPGESYAGCTCSTAYTQKRRPPEEVARIKAERRRMEEDRILAQADLIRAQRKTEIGEIAENMPQLYSAWQSARSNQGSFSGQRNDR